MDPGDATSDDDLLLPVEEMSEGESEGGADNRPSKEEGATTAPSRWKKAASWRFWFSLFFTQLTRDSGKAKLTMKRSMAIELLLYSSHWCSAWGDRMWAFAISLLLVSFYPESLLMPGVYGFLLQLSVVVFGTVVGDWVDLNPRLRVVFLTLLVQNSLVLLCSVALAVAFSLEVSACNELLPFALTVVVVIILGSSANLATVANTIAVERDWVVVIADKNESALAVLNANMRRIDLCCKLLAPTVTGVVLTTTSPAGCAIFVAAWNVVSFFVEFGLMFAVYRLVPRLKVKKYRKREVEVVVVEEEEEKEEEQEEEGKVKENSRKEDAEGSCDDEVPILSDTAECNTQTASGMKDDDTQLKKQDKDHQLERPSASSSDGRRGKGKVCTHKTMSFMKKLASPVFILRDGWKIYKRQDIAVVGFAMASLYLTVLGFSGVTSAYFLTQRLSQALIGLCQGIGAIIGITGTLVFQPIRDRVGTVRSGLIGMSFQLSALILFCGSSVFVPGYPVPQTSGSYYDPYCDTNTTVNDITPTRTYPLHNGSLITPTQTISSSVEPSPAPSAPGDTPGDFPFASVHIGLLMTGLLTARFGLWMFDLAVSQLIQENVPEEERGVFSGVMNVFISIMDMMHYVLVIFAPNPTHFRYLAVISIAMVALGYLLYLVYVRRVRGHLLHCSALVRACKRHCGKSAVQHQQLREEEEEEEEA